MVVGLFVDRPQSVTIKEVPNPPLKDDEVRLRTEFASIKHGTDFHLFSGQSPFQDRYFDARLRLFVPRDDPEPRGDLVSQFVGNMAVGTVVEIGRAVTSVRRGDRVYGYGPVCDRLVKAESEVSLLPPAMTALEAVCLDPALYAYAAVRDAKPGVGDNVVVFGLGAIGLFVVQLLRLSGCLHIIAVDRIAKRRAIAGELGADLVLDPSMCDIALAIRDQCGQGADLAIEASGHYAALATAMRAVQQCGRIVTLGFYKGKDTALELGAEWLHNRLELICSMPVWGNPLREYPLWTVERLTQMLVDLFSRKALTAERIVDPIVDFVDAPQAFTDIYHDPGASVKLGIRFPTPGQTGAALVPNQNDSLTIRRP